MLTLLTTACVEAVFNIAVLAGDSVITRQLQWKSAYSYPDIGDASFNCAL